MVIIPNQDFKHEGQSFTKGVECEVSDEVAEYFASAGWVGDSDATIFHGLLVPLNAPTSLDIHDIRIAHKPEVN